MERQGGILDSKLISTLVQIVAPSHSPDLVPAFVLCAFSKSLPQSWSGGKARSGQGVASGEDTRVPTKSPVLSSVVQHVFNPSTEETDTAGSLWVPGQSDLHSVFQINQDYIVTPCLQNRSLLWS